MTEDILLPSFAGYGDAEAPIVARVMLDHVRIRRLADEVATEPAAIDVLHALGERLGEHIRREERELFPLIEQALPDAELERLVRLLA